MKEIKRNNRKHGRYSRYVFIPACIRKGKMSKWQYLSSLTFYTYKLIGCKKDNIFLKKISLMSPDLRNRIQS